MSATFRRVSCLFQDPAAQLFEPTVERELAFGLQSLGLPSKEIRVRIERISSRMGITDLLQRAPHSLSGGQQQLIVLAAFLALAPQLLVLDEPMTMLDARARHRIYAALQEAHIRGTGLIVIDHQLELYAESAARFALITGGAITIEGSPTEFATTLLRRSHLGVAPPPVLLWWKERILPGLQRHEQRHEAARAAASATPTLSHLPLTRKEARRLIEQLPVEALEEMRSRVTMQGRPAPVASPQHLAAGLPPLIEWNNVSYTYPPTFAKSWLPAPLMSGVTWTGNALHEVSSMIWPGEIVALVGPNGAGKTTLLRTLNGLVRPQQGEVRVCGKRTGQRPVAELAQAVGYAPQRPERLFFCATVAEELMAGPRALGIEEATRGWQTLLIEAFGLGALLNQSPYTLSLGQQRKVALAAALASRPPVVALDEPTAGLDAGAQATVTSVLREVAAAGAAVVIVTHDLEFASAIASRWLVLVAGGLLADDTPARIMKNDALLVEAALEPCASYQLDSWLSERLAGEKRL